MSPCKELRNWNQGRRGCPMKTVQLVPLPLPSCRSREEKAKREALEAQKARDLVGALTA